MTEITKRDCCGVTGRVRTLVNQEALMRKCVQKVSQITRIHPTFPFPECCVMCRVTVYPRVDETEVC